MRFEFEVVGQLRVAEAGQQRAGNARNVTEPVTAVADFSRLQIRFSEMLCFEARSDSGFGPPGKFTPAGSVPNRPVSGAGRENSENKLFVGSVNEALSSQPKMPV